MRWRPNLLERRAVRGPVKAWPGRIEAHGKARATASLDGSLRAARLHPQVGTKERLQGTN
jgi:hypothetical protein